MTLSRFPWTQSVHGYNVLIVDCKHNRCIDIVLIVDCKRIENRYRFLIVDCEDILCIDIVCWLMTRSHSVHWYSVDLCWLWTHLVHCYSVVTKWLRTNLVHCCSVFNIVFEHILTFWTVNFKSHKISHNTRQGFNPFQPSVTLYIETSHLFCFAKQMTSFHMKRNTGLEWVNGSKW